MQCNDYNDSPFNSNIQLTETKPMVFHGIKPAVSNDLIFGTQEMTIGARHLLMLILAQINTTEPDYDHPTYRTTAMELAKALGYHGKNKYRQIKSAVNDLSNGEVTVQTPQGSKVYHWFSDIRYEVGNVYAKPDPALLGDHVLGLKRDFTVYDLDILLTLSSIRALRLYEVLYALIGKQYLSKALGRGQCIEITMSRESLNHILASDKTQYNNHDFYRRILSPAVEEISQKTDLTIAGVRQESRGYAISGYTFEIRKRVFQPIERQSVSLIKNNEETDKTGHDETTSCDDRSWFYEKSPEEWKNDFMAKVCQHKIHRE